MRKPGLRGFRRSCARAPAKSKPPRPESFPRWSSVMTSAAICTCTRPTATAGTRSKRWWTRRARSATSTSRSPITRTRAAASRTLAITDIPRQRDEIARLRERYPAMAILHGIEVDILADGRLDFDDEVLAQLDIVLASLHDRAGHDAKRLTRRLLERSGIRWSTSSPIPRTASWAAARAIRWTSTRSMPRRPRPARRSRSTALPATWISMASTRERRCAAGVTVDVDSDCHRAAALDRQMKLGVGTARRGLGRAREVLNTRPIAEVRAFVGAKRRRGGWHIRLSPRASLTTSPHEDQLDRIGFCPCRSPRPVLRRQSTPAATEVAAALQRKYDPIRDFSADFAHEYESGVLGRRSVERGYGAGEEAGQDALGLQGAREEAVRLRRPPDLSARPGRQPGHRQPGSASRIRRRPRCCSSSARAT